MPEAEIVERYHDTVVERCGIRRYGDDGAMVDNTAPLLTSVFLDKDLTFVVGSEAEAQAFVDADPGAHGRSRRSPDGDWPVTRQAGTEIRVPRKMKLSRTVGGQIPTGFDPTMLGHLGRHGRVGRPGRAVEHRLPPSTRSSPRASAPPS